MLLRYIDPLSLMVSIHVSPLSKSLCCIRSLVLAGPDQHLGDTFPLSGIWCAKRLARYSLPWQQPMSPLPGSGCRNMIERRWLIFISHIFHYEIFPLLFEILQLFDLVNEVSTSLFCIALVLELISFENMTNTNTIMFVGIVLYFNTMQAIMFICANCALL